jgi:hypothetical protein
MCELTCDDCGKTCDDVVETLCPYAEEINGTEVECKLCPDCYHERCMEI